MIQSFFISGSFPGQNEMLAAARSRRGKGSAYSVMKAKWTNDIAFIAKALNVMPVKRAFFGFAWVEKNRKRNPDNIAVFKKCVFDALQKAKVIENDGWGQITGWSDTFSIGPRPGVMVTICEEM